MKESKNIESRIEAALNSLHEIQQASPGDFFYTRVMARLNRTELSLWDKIVSFVAQPAVAVAVFLAVVLSNGIVIFNHQDQKSASIVSDITDRGVAEEYNQTFVAAYDPENMAP